MQRDPLEYIDSLNAYAYVANNPINFIDPLGLERAGGSGNVGPGRPGVTTGAVGFSRGVATGFVRGVVGLVTGISQTIQHPIDTGTQLIGSVINLPETLTQIGQQLGAIGNTIANGTAYERGQLVGEGLAFIAGGEAIKAVTGAARLGRAGQVEAEAAGAVGQTRALVPYYPNNNGFLGTPNEIVMKQGQILDRVGGNSSSRFFSPSGTPISMRSLPPGTTGPLRTFELLQPFKAEVGTVAPAFGEIGLGQQVRSSSTLGELIDEGFIREVSP